MAWLQAVVLSTFLAVSWSAEDLTLPPGFKLGAATAAYQVEGAWNVSDKGESIWDRFTRDDPARIADLSNGEVACNSYHNWKTDIEMAEKLGLHFYRFSISWPRLLPTGYPTHISDDGKNYYNNLINGLLEKGIEPFITLYHWDLPQSLQDLGGWTNPLIADWFADYVRVVFALFGDRVKLWLTINEPLIICDAAYGFNIPILAPGFYSPEIGVYLCNKHVLMAHAKAWRVYDEEFKPKYHGKVTIANQLAWFDPYSEEDVELAQLAVQHCAGRYSHPIYSKEGGWPPSIEKHLEGLSLQKGYSKSMLPAFTKEEIELIKGTYDYYAFNYYTSHLIRKAREGEEFRPWPLYDAEHLDAIIEKHEDWGTTEAVDWFYIAPEGIRRQLVWLKENYGDMEFIITENGLPSKGERHDLDRIEYIRDHLKQILLAVKEDGVNVTRYTAWSFMDAFEWMDGYSTKMGLYEVNFTDPLRTRTPRDSARYYARVIENHSLDVPTIQEDM